MPVSVFHFLPDPPCIATSTNKPPISSNRAPATKVFAAGNSDCWINCLSPCLHFGYIQFSTTLAREVFYGLNSKVYGIVQQLDESFTSRFFSWYICTVVLSWLKPCRLLSDISHKNVLQYSVLLEYYSTCIQVNMCMHMCSTTCTLLYYAYFPFCWHLASTFLIGQLSGIWHLLWEWRCMVSFRLAHWRPNV